MSRFARDVSDHELGDYQRAVRLVLRYGLVTATWPTAKSLPLVRRFAATLRSDLHEAFDYRLELHGATARLVRVKDLLDGTQPAVRKDRVFDRQRYAYLMLCLAVLGRAGVQITLSELADSVAADAGRIAGLGLDPNKQADRRAFVDAVAWLEERGALGLADGSTTAWATGGGEALYDIARDVLFAIYRPTRMVQAVESVTALLGGVTGGVAASGNEERRQAAQWARRVVVERPVVYFMDVDDGVANHLRGPALAEDLRRLTGLRVERRAEGVLLVDTAGFSADRFPGSAQVTRVANLLIVAMGDRITDPDGRRVRRLAGPPPAELEAELVALVDAGRPEASQLHLLAAEPATGPSDGAVDGMVDEVGVDTGRLPFIADSFLRTAVAELLERLGITISPDWRADPERLRLAAVELLARFGIVRPVPGGVLVLPLAGRYRNTTVQTRPRGAQKELF